MDQIMLMQQAAQGIGLQGLPGLLDNQKPQGDAFLALLQTLLGNGEESADSILADLLLQMQGGKSEEEPNDAAMQMMAMMMFPSFAAQQMVPEQQSEAGQKVQWQNPGAAAMQNADFITENRTAREPAAEISFEPLQNARNAQAESGAVQSEVTVLQDGSADLQEQFQFRSMMSQVQRSVKSEQKPAEETKLDLEQLQADVDIKRFLPQEAVRRTELPTPASEPVTTQLKTGILENLGKDEFVMKLQPEGLGEVTIRMAETDGKLILSIVTSTEHAAKAINQDLAMLQQALKPLQVEVQEVSTAAEQFGFAERQFGGHRFRDRDQSAEYTYYSEREEKIEAAEMPGSAPVYAGGLDAYI